MTSHRSGETEDSFIADLAVGLATGQIKTGDPRHVDRRPATPYPPPRTLVGGSLWPCLAWPCPPHAAARHQDKAPMPMAPPMTGHATYHLTYLLRRRPLSLLPHTYLLYRRPLPLLPPTSRLYRRPLPLRAPGQVQPAAPYRGGARRVCRVHGRRLPPAPPRQVSRAPTAPHGGWDAGR